MPHRGRNNGPRNPVEVGLDLPRSIHMTTGDGYEDQTGYLPETCGKLFTSTGLGIVHWK